MQKSAIRGKYYADKPIFNKISLFEVREGRWRVEKNATTAVCFNMERDIQGWRLLSLP